MATNLDLDQQLIDRVVKAGGFKTKKDAVNTALRDYLRRKAYENIRSAAGTIEWDEDYDYKALRNKR